MVSTGVWLAAIGPLLLVAFALMPLKARTGARVAVVAGAINLALAAAAATVLAIDGPMRTPTIGPSGVGLALYLDALTAAMLVLVSFVGSIVLAYSKNYLDGDPRHDRFTRFLCATLASVLFVIISGNLLIFALAWIATSLSLQRLLLFYPDRPGAAFAARKKFIVSRLSDLALIGALVLVYHTFGSLDYADLFAHAAQLRDGVVPVAIHTAAILLVIAGLLASAQFPLHGWLLDVMETPTPVSALLHAGIINAGGFLVLRFSGLVSLSLPSLELLAVIGGFTALFGSVVMLTQTSVKVTLAYSTIAQMGFMMLECGLVAFPAALLHIIAHSLYKAHAFLASGSVIDLSRASWTPSPGNKPHPWRYAVAVAAVLVVAFAVARAFGASLTEEPGVFTLGAVVLLALVHLVASAVDRRPDVFVLGRTIITALAVAFAYFALQALMERLFDAALPAAKTLTGPFAIAVSTLVIASFAIVTFLQGLVPGDGSTPRWQRLYALIANGLYVNVLTNRLVLRYWPPRVAARPLEGGN